MNWQQLMSPRHFVHVGQESNLIIILVANEGTGDDNHSNTLSAHMHHLPRVSGSRYDHDCWR